MNIHDLIDLHKIVDFNPGSRHEDQCLRLFLLIRLLQQSNRFVTRNPVTGLTIHESSFLLEIDGRKDCRSQTLEQLFRLDQSTISRHLKKLDQLKLIKKIADKADRREKTLQISLQGKKLLSLHDKLSNEIVRAYSSRVSKEEMNSIISIFQIFSEGQHTPEAIIRPHEHPIRGVMRRLALSLGITNAEYMGSKLTSILWNLLAEILFQGEVRSILDLIEALTVSRANLSFLLNKLSQQKLIQKITSSEDKREITLIPIEKGQKEVSLICRNATLRFAKSLKSVDGSLFDFALESIRKMIGRIEDGRYLLEGDYSYKICHDSRSMPVLRKFLLQISAKNELLHEIGPIVCDEQSKVFVIFERDNPVGLIEYGDKSDKIEIRNRCVEANISADIWKKFETDSMAHITKFALS